MAGHSEISNLLYFLINTCRDGEKGYSEAANVLTDSSARRFCLEQSRRRGQFADLLEAEMKFWLSDRDWHTGNGSVAAQLHRAWFELRSRLDGDQAVLRAVETGEDRARRNYEKALANVNVPERLRTTLTQQAQSIAAAYAEVRNFIGRTLIV